MALPKKAKAGDNFEKVIVNIYDIHSKEIVFTGGIDDVKSFLKSNINVLQYIKLKTRFNKKYALRFAKETTQ